MSYPDLLPYTSLPVYCTHNTFCGHLLHRFHRKRSFVFFYIILSIMIWQIMQIAIEDWHYEKRWKQINISLLYLNSFFWFILPFFFMLHTWKPSFVPALCSCWAICIPILWYMVLSRFLCKATLLLSSIDTTITVSFICLFVFLYSVVLTFSFYFFFYYNSIVMRFSDISRSMIISRVLLFAAGTSNS